MPTCMRQQWPTPAHGALRLQPTNRAVKLGRPVGRRYKHVLTQSQVKTVSGCFNVLFQLYFIMCDGKSIVFRDIGAEDYNVTLLNA